MRRFFFLAAILAAAACAAPRVQAPPPKLAIADDAWNLEPCKSNSMLQRLYRKPAHAWPVPLPNTRGLEFKILFYPLTWAYGPKGSNYGPVAQAVFDAEAGVLVSCSYTALTPQSLPGAPAPARPPERAWRLYELTEKAALAYGSGKPPADAEKKLAKEYLALFESLAEPALRSDYEAINPEFWLWVRRAALK